MTFLEFKNEINELDKLIYAQESPSNEKIFPICDGIINLEKFSIAPLKILWILKEPYDSVDINGKPFGGGWHIKNGINATRTFREFARTGSTYGPMTYTSWGILNSFTPFEKMKNIRHDHTMLDALKSIAYINMKKMPGGTSSSPAVVARAYKQNRDILLKQIEHINPDVIIGGNTLSHFIKDLELPKLKEFGSLNYAVKSGKIFIDAYHPAFRPGKTKITRQQYCNDIISVVANSAGELGA